MSWFQNIFVSVLSIALGGGLVQPILAAEKIELTESATDQRPFRITVHMDLEGQVQTAIGDAKAASMKLAGSANLKFHERRLVSLGRDAAGFRGLRFYDQAELVSEVADRKTEASLRANMRHIVAEGQVEGLRLYSPNGPLTYEEIELLRPPVDSLTALSLLPADRVEVGEKWEVPRWSYQFLTGLEAIEKGNVTCTLLSIDNQLCKVTFTGEVVGGTLGASTQIALQGHFLYDLKERCLTEIELNQTENRAIGAASPGLKVTAKATLKRHPIESLDALNEAMISAVPRVPDRGLLLLLLDSTEWGAKIYHDRQWHLFHQSPTVSVLRFMDKGTLVAQCNVSPIGAAPAGKHISEKQFQQDVQKAIGPEFRQIDKVDVIPTKDQRYILRVASSGEAIQKTSKGVQKIPVSWIYYLVAHPDGRQIVLVFTIEAVLMERFMERDINLALGVDFLPRKSAK